MLKDQYSHSLEEAKAKWVTFHQLYLEAERETRRVEASMQEPSKWLITKDRLNA